VSRRIPHLRPARLDPVLVDAVVAVGIAAALVAELRDQVIHRPLTAVAAVLVSAPIAIRRRWPVLALVASSFAALAQGLLGGHMTDANGLVLAPILLCYGAGAWADRRRGMAATAAATASYAALAISTGTPGSAGQTLAQIIFAGLLCVPASLVGRIARTRTLRTDAFRRLADQTADDVRAKERLAAADERARIGRELHDIVARSVAAMIVQAGGARRVLTSDPGRARASIADIERTGREALTDMRRLLGILRQEGDPAALAPQPGLRELEALIRDARARGVACAVSVEGEPAGVTPGVDLVAYRVIEVALAGAGRGAGSTGSVIVRHDPPRLRIEVCGDWRPVDLTGTAERVALYDGTLELQPSLRGFTLRAVLPMAAATA
jgi:signal transduction histidine kinase